MKALYDALLEVVNTVIETVQHLLNTLLDLRDRMEANSRAREGIELTELYAYGRPEPVATYPDGTPVDARRIVRRYVPRRTD